MRFFGNRGAMNWEFRDDGDSLFLMQSDGDFHANGDVIAASTTISDKRLKDNIEYIGRSKDGHKIYIWEWNDIAQELGVDTPTIGVLAQEVLQYMPEAVIKDENGYYKVNYGVL